MSAIRIHHLTKRYGPVRGVDDLSFEVRPGQVTGFLVLAGYAIALLLAAAGTTMRRDVA